MITIQLNGEARTLPCGATLEDLIASCEVLPQALATAVNGEFVAKHARPQFSLREGDAVFTFQPITGG